jgi:hypothetical protein
MQTIREGLTMIGAAIGFLVLTTLLVLSLIGFNGCASVGQFKPVDPTTCDKIQFYNSYVEGAQKAVVMLQLIPGIAGYANAAATALLQVDSALDDATALCILAAQGKSSAEQTQAALDLVYNAVTKFNGAYGQAREVSKPPQ